MDWLFLSVLRWAGSCFPGPAGAVALRLVVLPALEPELFVFFQRPASPVFRLPDPSPVHSRERRADRSCALEPASPDLRSI